MTPSSSSRPSGSFPIDENSSATRTSVESSSDFQWERTALLILWLLLIVVLAMLAVIGCQKAQRATKDGRSVCWHAWTLSIISCVSLLFAISLSIAPHVNCHFIYITDNDSNIKLEALGIWKLQRNNGNGGDECYPYSTIGYPREDAAVRATRAFGVMAFTCGGAAIIYYMVSIAFGFSRKFLSLLFVFISVIQAFTLILFQNAICDVLTCELAEGSLASLTAVAYWLLGALGIYMQNCSCSQQEEISVSVHEEAEVVDP